MLVSPIGISTSCPISTNFNSKAKVSEKKKFLDKFLDMYGAVVLRQECCILLLSCRGKLKHPQFGSLRRQGAPACWLMSMCLLAIEGTLPLLSQQSCRGFKSSWKLCGREERQGGALHIIKRCRAQGVEGNAQAKPEWITMRDIIGLKMWRNPGFFTVLYNLFIRALWWAQGSPSVTNGR